MAFDLAHDKIKYIQFQKRVAYYIPKTPAEVLCKKVFPSNKKSKVKKSINQFQKVLLLLHAKKSEVAKEVFSFFHSFSFFYYNIFRVLMLEYGWKERALSHERKNYRFSPYYIMTKATILCFCYISHIKRFMKQMECLVYKNKKRKPKIKIIVLSNCIFRLLLLFRKPRIVSFLLNFCEQ